ncbi:unnamed protein product [Nezara viridula]|uniref:Uncharacterized protein n=1 Tax=Nezara viridula TaxID=85310 RepID=A0A9P0MS69_NEZVI|nr:unnamed protein product [Nezara viridula]
MFTQVGESMEQEFSQTISSLVKRLKRKNGVTGISEELLKKQTYNLMKQLARKIVYQTDQTMNGETKTELTEKTEFSMRESVYTLIRKKPQKKKKEGVKSQVLKQNTRSLHYSNICQMIKNNTTKLIRNKLTLHEKSKKIVKKRTYNREKSLTGNIESMEKLLSCWKKDFKRKAIVEDLKWSMKSIYKSFTMRNEIMEQHIEPVAIVPPLSLPMWAKALDEPPHTVILRRTPSLNSFFDQRTLRSKVIMRRRMRNGSRKPNSCVIPTETLARALNNQKWNKGPRQVPVSTFQATRIHYRFLLAKYGKSRLMGRQRVYPNSIKSNVHSNFSVINLLHDVEEAISQNKYSKETDRIVKNFKEELNKDLLNNEPINKKYKYQIGNPNNSGTRKKSKLTKLSSVISLSELVEKLGGNDSEESCNDLESVQESKSESCIETGHSQYLNTNKPVINSLVDSDSNSKLFKSLNNDFPITDASNKLKNNVEDIEGSKVSPNKKFISKEKRNIKKKKTLMKETKPENISEEERLNAILQELQKQVKVSEPPTPIFLTKNDSLTELNFEKEPCTYLSMHPSSITLDSDSQTSHLESTPQKECSITELSEQESKHSLLPPSEPVPIIKKKKPLKSEHSSSKSYSFRIDYECIKNKPMSICNIITALERVNKLLQNIPIQYDKHTGRPYIVYDPKTIVKVIKEVNIKHEYKMVVKKYNKKAKIDSDTDKSICETNKMKTSKIETIKKDEKGLTEVGNQLLQCILNLMEPSNLNESICCIKDQDEYNKYSQTFDQENSDIDQSLEDMTGSRSIDQLTYTTETLQYKKIYFEQIIKIASAYQINGIYHQAIIYMDRQEYFNTIESTTCQKVQIKMHNTKQSKEKNTTKFSNGTYAELKEKYMVEFRERKNIPNELSKKYCRYSTNENPKQTQTNISQKYYHQYNKTRKLLLSKYEIKRNIKKESVEKGLNKGCLKTDESESHNNNEKNVKTNYSSKHGLFRTVDKPENTSQITYIPTVHNNEKSHIHFEKRYKTIKDVELIQSHKRKDIKNNYTKGYNRPHFNPLSTFDTMGQMNTNKNDLLVNKQNISEGFGGFALNKSIMNSMLRSVSINTIPNTYPMRKDITKQIFYFQITYPFIKDLNDFYKKRPSQEYFKPSEDDIFSKFIYYKENSKSQTYKNDINQQVIDSVNTIKNDLNNNINNICQIVNIDNQLLTRFLKICLKQNELDFEEDKKLLILETEMEELKSLMEKRLDKKTVPVRPIQRKIKEPGISGQQKIHVLDNNSKIKQKILKNGLNMKEINTNQLFGNKGRYNETRNPVIEDLYDISKKLSKEFFEVSQNVILSEFINYEESGKLQAYKKDFNQSAMDSVNTIENELNKYIINISKIANINNQILIKFLKICLKQKETGMKEDEKSYIFEKEMKELKSLIEEHLGKKTNPLKLIQTKQKGPCTSGYKKMILFDINLKIVQSVLKNKLNMEETTINQHINNNSWCLDLLRFLNFLMLIYTLFSIFN